MRFSLFLIAALLSASSLARAEEPVPLVATSAGNAAPSAWSARADRETLHWCEGGLAAGLVLGGPLGCMGATGTALVLTPKSPADAPPEAQAAYAREMKKRRAAAALAGGTAAVIITTIGYGIAYAIHPPSAASDVPPGLRGPIRP